MQGVDVHKGMKKLDCRNSFSLSAQLKGTVFLLFAQVYKKSRWNQEKAILAPRNQEVDKINDIILVKIPGCFRT
uniref:Uncharacterized protein n=1 Tax=Lepeophtheirus salmonis TaxID=72036 RepID=A0A0K2T9K2_LEPSM